VLADSVAAPAPAACALPAPPAAPPPPAFPRTGEARFSGAIFVHGEPAAGAPPASPPPCAPPHLPSLGVPCVCGKPPTPGALAVQCASLGCPSIWHAFCAGLLRGGARPAQAPAARRWRCVGCRARGMTVRSAEGARVLGAAALHSPDAGAGGALRTVAHVNVVAPSGARVVLACVRADAGSPADEFALSWPPRQGAGDSVVVNGRAIRLRDGTWPPTSLMDITGFGDGSGALRVAATFLPPPGALPRLLVVIHLVGVPPAPPVLRSAVLARLLPPAFAEFAARTALAVRTLRAEAALEEGGGGRGGGGGGLPVLCADLSTCALAALRGAAAPAAPAGGAAVFEESVPLTDPLTLGPLSIPVRGEHCEHAEALDLDGYLLANAKASARWECPLCAKGKAATGMLLPCHLWVDTFMWEALKRAAAAAPPAALAKRKLQLVPGEPWRLWPPLGVAEGAAAAASAPVCLSDDEGEEPPPPWSADALRRIDEATAAAARRAADAQRCRERQQREVDVVDLTGLT
jgi:hypothetical protein